MEVWGGVPVESRCETFSESLVSVIRDIRSGSSELLKKEIHEDIKKVIEILDRQVVKENKK